jgi:predicted RNA binding protein YcfA (HicA-like mRNA interferase family)
MPISGKEMVKLFQKHGFDIVQGQGKGSHIKLRKGANTVIVPNHRELKKGLECALIKQLEKTK